MEILSLRLWQGRSRIACKDKVTGSAGGVLGIPVSSGMHSRSQAAHRTGLSEARMFTGEGAWSPAIRD